MHTRVFLKLPGGSRITHAKNNSYTREIPKNCVGVAYTYARNGTGSGDEPPTHASLYALAF